MNVPFYIAKRYAVSFSKTSAINIITIIASLGIVAGTSALFIVLSAFSGLKDLSLSLVQVTDADFKITSKQGKSIILTPQQTEKLNSSSNIIAYSKTIEERVLFLYDNKEQVAYIKGVDSLFTKVSKVDQYLYMGSWLESQTNDVVVGSEISRKLGLGLFDFYNALKVYVPKAGKGTIDKVEDGFLIASLRSVGIYNINEDVDAKYVYCDLALAQYLLQYKKNQITSLEIKTKPNITESEFRNELESIFNYTINIKNRVQQNDSLYKMLNTENIAVYLIFTLVIIISLFNLIGAIIMMIIDKKSNLRTLNNLGISVASLRKIFLYQGLILTFLGCVVGLLIGFAFVFAQQKYSFLMISEVIAYPVKLDFNNITIVCVTILILGYLASVIASKRVTKKLLTNN